jgi:tRNA-specific 2-thiouridylase
MQLWNQRRGLTLDEHGEPLPSRCCSLDDVYDARRVAEELGFPFYVLNLERDFERDVVQPFVSSYLNGETPIPCVSCNSRLKFASLDRLALSLGCEKVATGHYARVEFDASTNRYKLLRGQNHQKDQSYFLWELTQEQLSRALFPLGEMSKPEARDAARQHGLTGVSEKKESQEICFVPDGDYAGLVKRLRPETEAPGEIVDLSGKVLGRHRGVVHFTVGQRRGIEVGGQSEPLYVVRIDPDQRRVVVGPRTALAVGGMRVEQWNWIGEEQREVSVKVRSLAPPVPATLDGEWVRFAKPEYGVAPGQAAVVYDGTRLLGGGWIAETLAAERSLPDAAAA